MYTATNPYYTARVRSASIQPTGRRHVWAKLPEVPITSSPVPHLTSLYHFNGAGPYGSRKWPGNCGGNLIKDLLLYFQPTGIVCDPFAGSGTCKEVCDELKLPCMSFDIHTGFDACDPEGFSRSPLFDLIWSHPPYWRMKEYSRDRRDLSRCPTLEAFLIRYAQFFRNCFASLNAGGKLCVLMGDYFDRDGGYIPLVYHTKRLAFAAGFKQHCTDIIRFSHGASSGKKTYTSSFIPSLHDVVAVFEKPMKI